MVASSKPIAAEMLATSAASPIAKTDDSSSVSAQAVQLLHRYETLCMNFQPSPYSGHVALIQSTEASQDPQVQLKKTLTSGFEEYVIPGLHLTIFEHPAHRQRLVQALEQALSTTSRSS